MKKRQLTSIAALGFLGAISQIEAAKDARKEIKRTENLYDEEDAATDEDNSMQQENDTCVLPSPEKERKLISQLNDKGRRTYNSLDCEGKNLAIRLAEQSCKGQNDCQGLNSCSSATNSCAGEGGCGGTSPAPFKDKNVAVQVAAKYMAEKRAKMYYKKEKFNNRYGY